MHYLLFLFFYCTALNPSLSAQTYSLHLVEFIHKQPTPYSIFKPQFFLSARAIERRIIQGVEIDERDLPIAPIYIEKIQALGVGIHNKSKWLNAISIHTEDQTVLQKIAHLPFVKSVRPMGKFRKAKKGKIYTKRPEIDSSKHQNNAYGLAHNQIDMLGGIQLHQLGYTGKDVQIAVVDGGFKNIYRMAVFDSMYLENRLLGTKDFVDGDDFVYEGSTHGTNVLSIMAAKRPNLMIGSAPDAAYYAFRTEDTRGEFQIEEFNWIAAMEYADSLGVDVVNSSMGYNRFDDENMSYRYEDLDGKTALITQGANIAVEKGLFIVNAAGNDGSAPWHYLFAPADAYNIFAIAAVDENRQLTDFSSWGPTADGRIKPDIAAQGGKTAYASMVKYDVGYGDGTSYSCPVVTGMVASLKQAFPYVQNKRLQEVLRQSGHLASSPHEALGYGIPNFWEAFMSLADSSIFIEHNGRLRSSQKLVYKQAHVYVDAQKAGKITLKLFNALGKKLYEEQLILVPNRFNKFSIPNFDQYGKGTYALNIQFNNRVYWAKLVK